MGMLHSKKSVDIAANTASAKKNGTDPTTDVKVKELVDDAPVKETTIEEVATTKTEETTENGDTTLPATEDTEKDKTPATPNGDAAPTSEENTPKVEVS